MALGINYERSAQNARSRRVAAALCQRSLQYGRKAVEEFRQIDSEGKPLAGQEELASLQRSIAACERIMAGSGP
jgi:hypothetical protein